MTHQFSTDRFRTWALKQSGANISISDGKIQIKWLIEGVETAENEEERSEAREDLAAFESTFLPRLAA